MTTIDETLDDVRDAATDFLNAEHRGPGHVALGIAVTAGFALLATAFATGALRPLRRDPANDHQDGPVTERPRGPISLVLPAVFSVTTLSALRVWNAPSRPGRKQALGLWAAAQAVNAVWIALRPAGRGLQIAAAMSSAGLAAAFAHEARKLDVGAGKLASPIGGRVRLANKLQGRSGDENRTAN
ncbi:TspO protein [uncultured Brevundimonas sp.]|uniref:TspO protein n=1 Tax=uncultured Brevundimonas sp. TaxID=213418 RepID=UPI0030EBE308|tara:strand:+ start:41023 stop:41577 length:555 start_codon:yes stop_codon:yes gene_type:complete